MSAVAIRRCRRARSCLSERSIETLFLLRLNMRKNPAPEPIRLRVLSPPGGSILITSAPRSPRIMPQVGPITMWENSTTRMPESGRLAPLLVPFFTPTVRAGTRLVFRTIDCVGCRALFLLSLGRLALGLGTQARRIKADIDNIGIEGVPARHGK